MELLKLFIENVFLLANGMSFFILVGLLIAGVLKEIVPADFVASHLGEGKTSSVIKATLFGIPLPVCSCSVIPLAKSLQKEGASKGAVQSFLISTPITGADSILATYGFFGWIFTLYRVLTSIFIAIVAGVIQNSVQKRESEVSSPKFGTQAATFESVKAATTTATAAGKFSLSPVSVAEEESCCSSGSCGATEDAGKRSFSFSRVFRYAFVTLFKDIYFSLFVGIMLGAAFTTFLPKELLAPLFEYRFLTYLAVLVIAMPLYVCATASLPIAAAFLLSGMSGGAAFVFLSAGPATNTVTMGVVASMFGKRSLLIYLGVISVLSILFGMVYDYSFDGLQVLNLTTQAESFGMLQYLSTGLMFGLIFYYLLRRK